MKPLIDQYGWAMGSAVSPPHAALRKMPGRILVQHRGSYVVATGTGEVPATDTLDARPARRAEEGIPPWVTGSPSRLKARRGTTATIYARSCRAPHRCTASWPILLKTAQVIAANIDVAFVVASMNADLKGRRLERYLAATLQSGARPVVVLTKADLAKDPESAVAAAFAVAAGDRSL